MIDLHTHTVYSDGSDTVETLLRRAQQAQLTCLSITDHNSVGAYRDPSMAQRQTLFSGRLLLGVEITCMFQGEIVEVLGYGYRLEQMEKALPQILLPSREKARREMDLLAAAYHRLGLVFDLAAIPFDPDRLSPRHAFWDELIRHPENHRFFSDPRSLESASSFTRREVYNPASPLYVDESSLYPTIVEAAETIHTCGGVALLAHLYIYAHALSFRSQLDDILALARLDGVECAHSDFTPEQIADLEGFCASRSLLSSGGSDYHGVRKPHISIGIGQGSLSVPERYLDPWPSLPT